MINKDTKDTTSFLVTKAARQMCQEKSIIVGTPDFQRRTNFSCTSASVGLIRLRRRRLHIQLQGQARTFPSQVHKRAGFRNPGAEGRAVWRLFPRE